MTSSLLNPKCGRRQYLITYSQADEQRFPTRESFTNVVVEEFNREHSTVKVSHWACCRELQQEGVFTITVQLNLLGTKNRFQQKRD